MGKKGVIMLFIFMEPLGKMQSFLLSPWAISLQLLQVSGVFSFKTRLYSLFCHAALRTQTMWADNVGCWPESCHLAVSQGCLVSSKVLCLIDKLGALWTKAINLVLYFTTPAPWDISLVINAIMDLGKEALNHFCMLQGRLFLPPLFYCFENCKISKSRIVSLSVHLLKYYNNKIL